MPDWFYRTVSRPMLFRLPAAPSRDLALGFMGTLARLPFGGSVIDLMGHMRPDPRLRKSLFGVDFPSRVGLGIGIDAHAYGVPALQRFGFAFLELGPVGAVAHEGVVERRADQQVLWYSEPPPTLPVEMLAARLKRLRKPRVPLVVRVAVPSDVAVHVALEAVHKVVDLLHEYVTLFSLSGAERLLCGDWREEDWQQYIRAVSDLVAESTAAGFLVCVPADVDGQQLTTVGQPLAQLTNAGLLLDGCLRQDNGRCQGPAAREPTIRLVHQCREHWPTLPIIAAGGIHEPDEALALYDAGADLVQIDTGLIYSGPGLPKRINEAVLWAERDQHKDDDEQPLTQTTWFWTMLMGIGLFGGGVMALIIAATGVLLPYDEWQSGMTRADLAKINPRLLAFMAHDRVTLAGTMLAVGILYISLAYFAIRHGIHWARMTVLASAFIGFFNFFLFLGFGYFDPFHAFVTAIMFQFLLFALYSRLPPARYTIPANRREDWRWRLAQWGQLLFVMHGSILILAGMTICYVGITTVFVAEDLDFMQTTAQKLREAHPRLVPLIAHDRASFGGMLITTGVTVLLSSLWGFREGHRWQWWSLLLAGSAAYVSTIWVHMAVGYTHFNHLLPAYGGMGVLMLSSILTYPYMCQVPKE